MIGGLLVAVYSLEQSAASVASRDDNEASMQ